MDPAIKPRFYELNKEFYAQKIRYEDIAETLNKSVGYVGLRMREQKEWHIDDCYKILKLIDADPQLLTFYFPPEIEEEIGEVQYGQTYTQPA